MPRPTLILVLSAALSLPSAEGAAAPSEKELRKQQIAYAKELYVAGVKAMEAEDYGKALQYFDEAYRYAPDKHVFSFNVGMAAHLGGDCVRAKASFEYFLKMVKKHPERRTAAKRLKEIRASGCAERPAPTTQPSESDSDPDDDRIEAVPTGSAKDREKAREEAKRWATLFKALDEVHDSARQYRAVAKQHGKKRPFSGVARHKERYEKKLLKALKGWGKQPPDRPLMIADPKVGKTFQAACKKAVVREKKAAKKFEKAMDVIDELDLYRLLTKLERASSKRNQKVFERCAKQKQKKQKKKK
jgi:tetratricopeptide (TPR) repeat protein